MLGPFAGRNVTVAGLRFVEMALPASAVLLRFDKLRSGVSHVSFQHPPVVAVSFGSAFQRSASGSKPAVKVGREIRQVRAANYDMDKEKSAQPLQRF
jgi:hypothetical protein